jgi:ferredoxin
MKLISLNIVGTTKILETYTRNTLLELALEEGISVPCECKVGNCEACKCKLLSGEVELLPYSEYALSKIEREIGFILACHALVITDILVEYYASK